MQPIIELAQAAAEAGAEVLREKFHRGISARSKAPADLVTEADIQSERVILDLIRESFPAHGVLAEESAGDVGDSEYLWVVDPLDGTTNFVHGIPHVAVSIACYRNGEPLAGVVLNPIRGDHYEAVKGGGATANGQQVRVSSAAMQDSLVGVGFYYDRGSMMRATLNAIRDVFECQVHGIRRFGTAALDLCQVGTGQFGGFFEYQLSPWDFAAGRLFVEEAGGLVSTCDGKPLPLETTSVLSGSPTVYEVLLPIVSRHAAASSE